MTILSPITTTTFRESVSSANTKREFTSTGVQFVNLSDVHVYFERGGVVEELFDGYRKNIAVNPGPVTIIFDTAPTGGEVVISYDTESVSVSTDFRRSSSGTDANKEFFRTLSYLKQAILSAVTKSGDYTDAELQRILENIITKINTDVASNSRGDRKYTDDEIDDLRTDLTALINAIETGFASDEYDADSGILTLRFGDGTSVAINLNELLSGKLDEILAEAKQYTDDHPGVGGDGRFVNDSDWETADERLVLRWNNGLFATAQHIPISDYVDAGRLKAFNNTTIYTSPDIFYWYHDNVMYVFRVRNGQTFQASVDAPTFQTGRDTQYYSDTNTNANAKLELIANLSDFASFSDIRPVVSNGQLRIGVVIKTDLAHKWYSIQTLCQLEEEAELD